MFLTDSIFGLLLLNYGSDILLHDTDFVVTHFHYILSLDTVTGVLYGFTCQS